MSNVRAVIEGMFNIVDKDGNAVPFVLNSAQQQVDATFTGRDLYPKARQEGVSSYFLARALAYCLGRDNIKAVIISHDSEATIKMLEKVHYMIEHIRGPKPVIGTSSKNEISFPKNNSKIYIGTAGSRKFGRGDTINFLHCSEVAYWENMKSILSGLFNAVPKSGEIAIESTGNGRGNWYHKICIRASEGKSRYTTHFLPWHNFNEYQYSLSLEEQALILESLDAELEEVELVEKHGLTAGQIAWRRDKLEEIDYDIPLFKQEYPMTLDECFKSSGNSIFHKVNLISLPQWQKIETNFFGLHNHPITEHSYAIGGDVSGGVGKDRSVLEIVDLNLMEQVGEYVNDRIAPDAFGVITEQYARRFNNAFVTMENNNHGIVTIKHLKDNYPAYLLYKKQKSPAKDEVDHIVDYGMRTSLKTKPLLIGNLRHSLVKDIIIHSNLLMDELLSFVEHENGSLSAMEGSFDDRVMAMAMCIHGIERALIYTGGVTIDGEYTKENNPFLLDNLLNELQSRGAMFPIKPQDESDDSFSFESVWRWAGGSSEDS